MTGTGRRRIATGLDESQVFRLFKCAVKDDDTLVDRNSRKTVPQDEGLDLERAEETWRC
jgi:IS4 transposase